MRKINVPAVALTAGLVLIATTPWLLGQAPVLPPVLPVEIPGEKAPTPPALDPLALPLPPGDSTHFPAKLPLTKIPLLPEPAPTEEGKTPTPLPQLPPVLAPVQPALSPRPPAFRLRSQQPQPGAMPVPPVAVIVERPPMLAGPPPSNLTLTPSLTLDKKGPPTVQVNQPFPYEIVVRNVGPVVALQVRLEDQLPPGTRFLSAKPPAAMQGDRLLWNIDQLAAGAERTFLVEVQPTTSADWKGDATLTVSASRGWRTAVMGPQLLLSVTGPSSVPLGSKAVFQICLTNSGEAALTELVVSDRLPPGLECIQARGSEIELKVGTLAPGETKKYDLETVATDLNHQVNETVVTTKEGQHASTRAIVVVTEPLLRLRQAGSLRPDVEHQQDYRLEVANRDKVAAHNVRVSQVLPPNLKFVSAGEGGTFQAETRTVVWQLGVLPAGQNRLLTLRLMPLAAGQILTQTTAHSDQGHDTSLFTILYAAASEVMLPTTVPASVRTVNGRAPGMKQ